MSFENINVPTAIEECLQASEFFLDFRVKQKLLNTCIVSKSSLSSDDQKQFSEKYKRILQNTAVSKCLAETKDIHIILTANQLDELISEKNGKRILLRLCNRFQHRLATKIASYIGEKTDIIPNFFIK